MIDWKQVKKYCEKHGYAKLASELGYKTSQTIQNWIIKKKIPGYMIQHVERILKSE